MKVVLAAVLLASASAASTAEADRIDPVPKALARVGVEEHLDAALPLQLSFKDERGRDVTLGSYFRPGRPVLLTLNYYRCPMLCTLELNGLVAGMRELAWTPGDEYEVVTVSFDPEETAASAAAKKLLYLEELGRPSAVNGWHFLTGSGAAVAALTKSVGFSFEYDEATGQYAHAAVVMLATPEGRLSRYLYGVTYEPGTLKLALREARRGTIGSTWERFLMYCYRYDPEKGRYTLAAISIMRAGAALTALALACVVGTFWIRDRRGAVR